MSGGEVVGIACQRTHGRAGRSAGWWPGLERNAKGAIDAETKYRASSVKRVFSVCSFLVEAGGFHPLSLTSCDRSGAVPIRALWVPSKRRSTTRSQQVRAHTAMICFHLHKYHCSHTRWFLRVLCSVLAQAVTPYLDRPTEGLVQVEVDISPMAAAHFKVGEISCHCFKISKFS